MKFSENWLRTLVNPPLPTRELAEAVTMSGVEVEQVELAAPPFDGVVVGEVLKVERHPDADRLTVCQVDVGSKTLTMVCGAPNVAPGFKAPICRRCRSRQPRCAAWSRTACCARRRISGWTWNQPAC